MFKIDHWHTKSPRSLQACCRQYVRATRYYFFLIAALVYVSSVTICLAQNSVSDRAAEWKSHALPTSEFNRLVDEYPESPFAVDARREIETLKKSA